MQNQPGAGPREYDPAERVRDRQAARIEEDAFKGGNAGKRLRVLGWLRNPWQPAAGRLFPDRVTPDDEK
jgi:hypothetical protein